MPAITTTATAMALARLAKDFETSIASAVAWIFVAHIRLLTRRLARL